MKTILLTSTALVMSVGMAVAEVSVSGDGRMGVVATNGGDVGFNSRVRIAFTATGETDNGLTFGGTIRVDNGSATTNAIGADGEPTRNPTGTALLNTGGGVNGAAGSVNVAGAFGTISMGDVSGAPEAAVGDASQSSLTGLGWHNELAYLSNAGRPAARWDYTMGNLTLRASADNPGPAGDQALGGSVVYSIGDVGFGLGIERNGDDTHTAAGVSATLGDASVKLAYGSKEDDDGSRGVGDDQYAASGTFVSGPATFTAFMARNFAEQDHFGISATYDLGGGAKIQGGFVDGDSLTGGSSFDLGITMGF